MKNKLYELAVKALSTPESGGPAGMRGAYVPCYIFAQDHQEALTKVAPLLASSGFKLESLQGDVREIPFGSWDGYIKSVWPDFSERLPSAAELEVLAGRGESFFGPFATY